MQHCHTRRMESIAQQRRSNWLAAAAVSQLPLVAEKIEALARRAQE